MPKTLLLPPDLIDASSAQESKTAASALQIAEYHALVMQEKFLNKKKFGYYASIFMLINPYLSYVWLRENNALLHPQLKLSAKRLAIYKFTAEFARVPSDDKMDTDSVYSYALNLSTEALEHKPSQIFDFNFSDFIFEASKKTFDYLSFNNIDNNTESIPTTISLKKTNLDQAIEKTSEYYAIILHFLVGAPLIFGASLSQFIFVPASIQIIAALLRQLALHVPWHKKPIEKSQIATINLKLKASNESLASTALRSMDYSDRLAYLFFIITACLVLAAFFHEPSNEFSFYNIAVASVNIILHLKEGREGEAILKLENDLGRIISDLGNAIAPYAKLSAHHCNNNLSKRLETVSNHYFLITSKNMDEIKASSINLILKHVLSNHGIPIVHSFHASDKTNIIIEGSEAMRAAGWRDIKVQLEEIIHKIKSIQKLHHHCLLLIDAVHAKEELLVWPKRDAKANPFCQFILLIPARYRSFFSEEAINKIFQANEITYDDVLPCEGTNSSDLRLSITGFSEANYKKLHALILKIKQFDNEPVQKSEAKDLLAFPAPITCSQENNNKRWPRLFKPFKQQSNPPVLKKNFPVLTPKHIKIQWKSASYDSFKSSSHIAPIASRYLPANRFFTYFALRPKDCGNDVELYRQIKDKAMHANLAAKRGEIGIKFISPRLKRDKDGNLFIATFKFKMLGLFGDWRAYGEEERSEHGEVLLVIKNLSPKAHKLD